jgi:hypothetical protein
MPTYSNAVAQTSQATTVSSSNLVISYANIALISTIPHKYQIEVERIFTTDRDGSSANVTSFLSDASVSVEAKRNVFTIPETHPSTAVALWTINETNKTITINNTNLATYTFTNASPSYSVPVPTVVDGQVVTIRRKTISNVPLVTWAAGNQLTSNQLNLETTQLLYLLQEVLDRVYRQISISGDIVSQIADNSVTTSKIVNLNVTTPKINDLAVTTGKLNDLAVTTGKLDNLAVTDAKIANTTITAGKLSTASQAWSLVGTLALTDLATSATGDKVTNKNYIIDRVSKYGVITKDSIDITTTQPSIGTTSTSDANDDISLQSGGIWFNPRDGGLRVRVLDKWVRVTGTPLQLPTDYISTGATEQTKSGNLILGGNLTVDTNTLFVNSSTNRVGVGTTSPTSTLDVNGTTTATAFVGPLTGNVTGDLTGNISGNTTVSGALTVSGNTTLNGSITGSTVGALASGLLPSGCVLQVVHNETTNTASIGSAWGAISGLSTSITPKRNNSKIFIICNMHLWLDANASGSGWISSRIVKGGSTVVASHGAVLYASPGTDTVMTQVTTFCVDTVSSLSTLTFQPELINSGSASATYAPANSEYGWANVAAAYPPTPATRHSMILVEVAV